MKKSRLNLFIVIVVAVVAAMIVLLVLKRNVDPVPRHTLTWSHGVNLYTVIYSIDGRQIGRGEAAYQELLELIQHLEDGTQLTIRCPRDVQELMFELTRVVNFLPFYGFEAEMEKFQSICAAKRFSVTVDSYNYDK